MWISKKLRVDTYKDAHHNDAPFTGHVPLRKLRHNAADTIDSLVDLLAVARKHMANDSPDCKDIDAALALARGEG